jgi:uncharacterized protein (TIGR03643 family)
MNKTRIEKLGLLEEDMEPIHLAKLKAKKIELPIKVLTPFSDSELDRIIQMAWEDRTPFEAIEFQFGLKEKEVIEFMRKHSLPSSFRMWRKRMKARKTKHQALRDSTIKRFKCSRQRATGNQISKR